MQLSLLTAPSFRIVDSTNSLTKLKLLDWSLGELLPSVQYRTIMSSGRLGGSHGESYIVHCNTKSGSGRYYQAHITATFSASTIKQLPGNLVMDRIPCSDKNRLTAADRLDKRLNATYSHCHAKFINSFVILNPIQTVIPVRRSKDRVWRGSGFKRNV